MEHADNLPDTHRTLGALLRRPYERLADWLYAELAARGHPEIRRAHSPVLRYLGPGGARLTELAGRAGLTKQSMAYLVESLAGHGYVETRPDPRDGRARLVQFTRRGVEVQRLAVELSARYERRLGERIGAAELARLRTLLEQVYDVLENDEEGPRRDGAEEGSIRPARAGHGTGSGGRGTGSGIGAASSPVTRDPRPPRSAGRARAAYSAARRARS